MSTTIEAINTELAMALRDFNRWMSQNSTVNMQESSLFKEQRQNIKILKLRKAELEEIENEHAESAFKMNYPITLQNNINISPFTKSRNIAPIEKMTGNKLGGRIFNKISNS